jgi:hypothetical protein
MLEKAGMSEMSLKDRKAIIKEISQNKEEFSPPRTLSIEGGPEN